MIGSLTNQDGGRKNLTFLEDDDPGRIEPVHIILLSLELEPLPAPQELDHMAEEVAGDQQGVDDHDERIDLVKPAAKEGDGIVDVPHPLLRTTQEPRPTLESEKRRGKIKKIFFWGRKWQSYYYCHLLEYSFGIPETNEIEEVVRNRSRISGNHPGGDVQSNIISRPSELNR